MEGKGDGNLANNAKPYDEVTQGDVVTGRLGKDAKGGKKAKKVAEVKMADLPSRQVKGKSYGNQDDYEKPPEDKRRPAKTMTSKKDKQPMKESQFKHNVRFVNESIGFYLSEDEEGKAKTITAAGDIVNDFTSWMQRVGQYQTKAIIELSDEIRAEFGQAEAEAFKQAVGPALSASLEVLTQQREAISNAVAQLATGVAPQDTMGAEPGVAGAPGLDSTQPDAMNPAEPAAPVDDFSAADAAAGGPEAAGREMRESKFARKLAESHSIMSKLAS
jgi:hypothetical protein